jgi:hypothetical protein
MKWQLDVPYYIGHWAPSPVSTGGTTYIERKKQSDQTEPK